MFSLSDPYSLEGMSDFFIILGLKLPIPLFSSSNQRFFFPPMKWFLSYRSGFAFGFSCFCCQPIAVCFAVNSLQQIVVLLMVSFFVGFRVDSSNNKSRSDRVIKSNLIHQCVTDSEF